MTETRSAMARRPSARAGGASSRGGSAGPGGTGGSGAARTSSKAGGSGRPDRAEAGSWPVRERSLVGPVLGIPPLVAVALAIGLTAVGVLIDLVRLGTVGTVFQIGYGVGCLLAVAWVRRRSIFLPAIQPPLLLAVVVPALAVLVGAPSSTAGVTEHLLLAGAPLINAFPAMAVTTVLVLLVAGLRLLRQRTGPDDAVGSFRKRLSGRAQEPSGPTSSEDTDRPGRTAAGSARAERSRPESGRRESGRRESGRARSGGASAAGASPGRATTGGAPAGSSSTGTSSGRATSGSASSKTRGTGSRAGSGAGSPAAGSSGSASSGTASSRSGSAGAGASGTGSRGRTSAARTRSADRRAARPDADDSGDRAAGTARPADPSNQGRPAAGRDRASGRRSGRSGTDGDGPRTRRSPRDTS